MVIVSAENFWNELTKVIYPSEGHPAACFACCLRSGVMALLMLALVRRSGSYYKSSALFQSENVIDQMAYCCRSEQGRTAGAFHACGTSCGSASSLVAWKRLMWWSSNRAAHSLHSGRRSEQDNMQLQLHEVPSGAGSLSGNIYQGLQSRL